MKEATLAEILNAREERMREQSELLSEYGKPLVSFSMNIAGPVKNSPLIKKAFEEGVRLLDDALERNGVNVLCSRRRDEVTGCELMYVVSCPEVSSDISDGSGAETSSEEKRGQEIQIIKNICVSIEEGSEMGRLFDMDVIDPDGVKVERAAERSCLICGKPGKGCASRRMHPVSELQKKTREIILDHFAVKEAEHISEMVTRALNEEVLTTPKPGLVDRNNNGSHSDMDIKTFAASANALRGYWGRCFLTGHKTADSEPEETFLLLRKEGIEAEHEMLRATGGVNTHKGAIFLIGTVCGAIGRLWNTGDGEVAGCISSHDERFDRDDGVAVRDASHDERFDQDDGMAVRDASHNERFDQDDGVSGRVASCIAEECRKMTGPAVEKELHEIDMPHTAGEKIWIEHGIKGARGEIAGGLPGVMETGLPVFERLLAEGADRNAAGSGAFIALIARGTDTNMIKRGGADLAEQAAGWASGLVSDNRLTDTQAIEVMDRKFIELNLSPGGCADLLAITYFLYDYHN